MLEISEGEVLFDHFERFLGSMDDSLRAKKNQNLPFEVFKYLKQPELDCQTLITFGLSAHSLHISGELDCKIRMELLVCANSSIDTKTLGSLLFAVGLKALRNFLTPGVHGVLSGSGPVLLGGNPVFEHLYLASPGFFSQEFEICNKLTPPISLIQIIPVSTKERQIIERQGWNVFENEIIKQSIDLLEFDTRSEVEY